jgi:hypothetical protein
VPHGRSSGQSRGFVMVSPFGLQPRRTFDLNERQLARSTMRLVAPRQHRNFPEDDVGAGHADVLEEMIAKFGQASSDLALLAPSLPVPEPHGSDAECDKEDCTTECGTP